MFLLLLFCASVESFSEVYRGRRSSRDGSSMERTPLKFYRNRARKFTTALIKSVIRKGGNFNEPDKDGRIPLLSLAELASAQRNIFSTGTFAELALGTSAQRVPPNWSLTDEQGNTALHLFFSSAPLPTEWRARRARRGATVQEFARMLCRGTAATKAALSDMDLLVVNSASESIIHLIADHCLHPRSRRADEEPWDWRPFGMTWAGGRHMVMPPERFPNCLRTHEKLYAAWMEMRAPLIKSVLTAQTMQRAANETLARRRPLTLFIVLLCVCSCSGANWKRS